MKTVNLKTFLTMPKGTLFSKAPLGCNELMIKGDNHPDGDFWMQSLTSGTGDFYDEALGYTAEGNAVDPASITGNSFDLVTDNEERGLEFSEDDLYVVYEQKDHRQLILRLLQGYVDAGMEPFDLRITAPVPENAEHKEVGKITLGELIRSLPAYRDAQGDIPEATAPVVVTQESLMMLEKAPNPVSDKADEPLPEIVIRLDDKGFSINYGRLVACNIDGVPFLIPVTSARSLGLKYVVMPQVPAFVNNFQIGLHSDTAQISVHALEKEDIADLAVALSKKFPTHVVGVGQKARWLQTWQAGNAQFPRRTLDYYYTDLSKEDIEQSKF